MGVGKNSIMEKNAKRKNTNGVKGHLKNCRNVGGGGGGWGGWGGAMPPHVDGHD